MSERDSIEGVHIHHAREVAGVHRVVHGPEKDKIVVATPTRCLEYTATFDLGGVNDRQTFHIHPTTDEHVAHADVDHAKRFQAMAQAYALFIAGDVDGALAIDAAAVRAELMARTPPVAFVESDLVRVISRRQNDGMPQPFYRFDRPVPDGALLRNIAGSWRVAAVESVPGEYVVIPEGGSAALADGAEVSL